MPNYSFNMYVKCLYFLCTCILCMYTCVYKHVCAHANQNYVGIFLKIWICEYYVKILIYFSMQVKCLYFLFTCIFVYVHKYCAQHVCAHVDARVQPQVLFLRRHQWGKLAVNRPQRSSCGPHSSVSGLAVCTNAPGSFTQCRNQTQVPLFVYQIILGQIPSPETSIL